MITCTICGRIEDIKEIYKLSAKLENDNGWNMWVPPDIKSFLRKDNLDYDYLNKIHYRKIELSEYTLIYFHKNSSLNDYKNSQTLQELKYAMRLHKEVYIVNPLKEMYEDDIQIDDFKIFRIKNYENEDLIDDFKIFRIKNYENEDLIKIDYISDFEEFVSRTPSAKVYYSQAAPDVRDFIPELGEIIKFIDSEDYVIGDGVTKLENLQRINLEEMEIEIDEDGFINTGDSI